MNIQTVEARPVCTLKSGLALEGKILCFATLPDGVVRYLVLLYDGTTEWFSQENVFSID